MSSSSLMQLDGYTVEAKRVVAAAQKLADNRHDTEVMPMHLLVCTLEASATAKELFAVLGSDPELLLASARASLDATKRTTHEDSYLSADMLALLSRAEQHRSKSGQLSLDLKHLIQAMLDDSNRELVALFLSRGVRKERFDEAARVFLEKKDLQNKAVLDPEKYSARMRAAIRRAGQLTDEHNHLMASPLHLLVSLLDHDEAAAGAFRELGVDADKLAQSGKALLASLSVRTGEDSTVSPMLVGLLRRAEQEATADGVTIVDVEHVLHAFAREVPNHAASLLWGQGIRSGAFREIDSPKK